MHFQSKKVKIVTEKGTRRYSAGIRMATMALLISIVFMIVNKFISIQKVPIKVKAEDFKNRITTPANIGLNTILLS